MAAHTRKETHNRWSVHFGRACGLWGKLNHNKAVIKKKKKRQFENKENPYYYVTHLTWHLAHPEPVPAEKSLGIGVALPCDQIMCDWKMTSYGAAFEVITLLSFPSPAVLHGDCAFARRWFGR